jgi:hypothetical protein
MALVQIYPSRAICGEDPGCKDSMRLELHWTDRGGPKNADARAYLWQHWSERKCGELLLTTWSLEGVRTYSRFEITPVQPDAVVLTVVLSSADDPSARIDGLAVPASGRIKPPPPETTSYQAYTVERVKPEVPYVVATAKVIQGHESLPPSKYRLRFKDKDGKVITDF